MAKKYYIVKLEKDGTGYIVGKASSLLSAMLMGRPERSLILIEQKELKRRWPEVVKSFEIGLRARVGGL